MGLSHKTGLSPIFYRKLNLEVIFPCSQIRKGAFLRNEYEWYYHPIAWGVSGTAPLHSSFINWNTCWLIRLYSTHLFFMSCSSGKIWILFLTETWQLIMECFPFIKLCPVRRQCLSDLTVTFRCGDELAVLPAGIFS